MSSERDARIYDRRLDGRSLLSLAVQYGLPVSEIASICRAQSRLVLRDVNALQGTRTPTGRMHTDDIGPSPAEVRRRQQELARRRQAEREDQEHARLAAWDRARQFLFDDADEDDDCSDPEPASAAA
jgi:hypothetical protein